MLTRRAICRPPVPSHGRSNGRKGDTVRLATGAVLLCAALLVAGCTSSKSGAGSTPSVPVTPSSPAATSTTPTPTPTHTTAKPKPKPKPKPVKPSSPFETDAAVVSLRGWANLAARDFNAGHKYRDPRLTAYETASFVPLIAENFASDAGLHYPGPVPFTPVAVHRLSGSERRIDACFVATGFAQNPRTGKPAKPLTLVPLTAQMFLEGGAWKINRLYDASGVSCSGVKVAMPTW